MLTCLWNDEGGATAVEYALVSSLIAVVLVTAVTLLGQNLLARYDSVASAFS